MPGLVDHTRTKVDGVIHTIEALQALDYPFEDSRRTLELVAADFRTLREDLKLVTPQTDAGVVDTLCRGALHAVEKYLPILGFLSRTSDLEAPVELHGPLLRLTCQAIQDDALLVICSDWLYSPFTFLFPELSKRGVVLVGMPRSESHNALIAPLSGHELGHNIWQKANLQGPYENAAMLAAIDEMKANWAAWKDRLGLDDPEKLSDLAGSKYWELPVAWAARQAEETFCDLVGLLIFREAYLRAFEYLLAPGDSVRNVFHYPDLSDRFAVLVKAAAAKGITVPPNYAAGVKKARVEVEEPFAQYAALADRVCSKLSDQLLNDAAHLVTQGKLSQYSEKEVAAAKAALNLAVPATGMTGIENILIAAWEHASNLNGFLGKSLPSVKDEDKEAVLHELTLKSFEVFEVEQRTKAK